MLVTSQVSPKIESNQTGDVTSSVITTTMESPKAPQTLTSTTSQSPISLSQSSSGSVSSLETGRYVSQGTVIESPTTSVASSQADLLNKANLYLEDSEQHTMGDTKELIADLVKALHKSKAESNQYKIQAQLLSLSAKDADMRYEVENELVKREVQRLKTQNEQVEYLMNKVTSQKQLIKKYKNEIINKNKEVIRLKTKINDYAHTTGLKKRRKSSTSPISTENGMLDTLGLLASQVLTEEESQEPPQARFQR